MGTVYRSLDLYVKALGASLLCVAAACGSDSAPPTTNPPVDSTPPLGVIGTGAITTRFTAEVAVRGSYAYTTTWSRRVDAGNIVNIWNVSANTPVLIDSLVVSGAGTLGDVQISDDGALLVVATEPLPGSIVIYSLANPAKPQFIARHQTVNTTHGVHTAKLARVGGKLYGFLSIDPSPSLLVVDLSNPASPEEVLVKPLGRPFMHDVFVRDGLLFTAEWNDGVTIWDIGGGGRSGTVANPVRIGNVKTVPVDPTVGSADHNIYWFQDPTNGSKRFAFVGEELVGVIGSSSQGDIHVIDVADMTAPREVAFFHVDGAGTHNFSVDETNGILYAAYYNAGVRALDIRGDLATCTAAQKSADGRCDLGKMGREIARGLQSGTPVYIWGVQFIGTNVYASDMLNGLWKLRAASR
jgi:hypothetical protein